MIVIYGAGGAGEAGEVEEVEENLALHDFGMTIVAPISRALFL
jgi:hypothetical protein